jgi:hypothetical protein
MKNATRILLRLAEGRASTDRLAKALGPVIPHATLCTTLSKVRKARHAELVRVEGTRAGEWKITAAGRAELRRLGHSVSSESEQRPSVFGSFGERLPRVASVFELGGLAA